MWFMPWIPEYTLIIKNQTLDSNLGFNNILENKTLT